MTQTDICCGLTKEECASYSSDGFVLLRGVIGQTRRALLCDAVDRRLRGTPDAQYFEHVRVFEQDPVFADYCLHSTVPALVARLLGSDRVNLLYDQLFVKEPGSATRTGWHNDQPYWPVRGWPVITMWLALDPVGLDNGPLEMIRGSHKWDRWYRPFHSTERGDFGKYKAGADPSFLDLPDFEAEREKHDIVPIEMAPGDVVAFHGLTVHAARGNLHQAARRRGYSVRYVGRGAVYQPGPATNAWLHDSALQPGDAIHSAMFPVAFQAQPPG